MIPILITYFIGFFIFRGLFSVFPLFIQLQRGLDDTEIVSIWATISGIALFIGAITRIPSGMISDTLGKKRTLFLAYTCYLIGMAFITFFNSIFFFTLAISLVRFGLNLYAMTGRSVVSMANREKGFKNGLLQSMVGMGSFMGPLLLSYALDQYSPEAMITVALVFIISDIVIFLISLKVIPMLFEYLSKGTEQMELDLHQRIERSSLHFRSGLTKRGVRISLVQFLSIGLVSGFASSVYTIYGYNILEISITQIGLIVGLASIIPVFAGPLSGKVYSRTREKTTNIVVWIGLVFSYGLLSSSRAFPLAFIISYFIMTTAYTVFLTTEITHLGVVLEPNEFTMIFGLASTLVIFGGAVASYVSPIFYNPLPEGTFLLAAIISIISLGISLRRSI
ncbi:MAG: MFS transporter [Candidatus Kariarchaeaceae archaeon]|jgi:MFS family permease